MQDQNLVDLLTFQRQPIPLAPKTDKDTPFAFVPEGYKTHSLEDMLERPVRKRANVGVYDSESFVAYVNRHKKDSTVIYAESDINTQKFTAIGVIDDHEPEAVNVANPTNNGAGRSEHWVKFIAQKSPEWIKWNKHDRVRMSQIDFAAFIEDNLPDIQSVDGSPSGGDMLKMAIDFEATYDKKFISKINNQSGGITMEFKSTDDKETVSRMSVFSRFTTGLKVFLNGKGYPLEARLKYKAANGELVFWYELIRPEVIFLAACDGVIAEIKEQTNVDLFNGVPSIEP